MLFTNISKHLSGLILVGDLEKIGPTRLHVLLEAFDLYLVHVAQQVVEGRVSLSVEHMAGDKDQGDGFLGAGRSGLATREADCSESVWRLKHGPGCQLIKQ